MENQELEKSQAFVIVEILGYLPNSVLIKTIVRKTTGNVTAVSFDTGAAIKEKSSPFDTLIQIIEGTGEIVIGGRASALKQDSLSLSQRTRAIVLKLWNVLR